MSETNVLKTVQIVSTPDVLGGKPCLEGRRVSVQQIADYHHAGWPVAEISEALGLSLAEVHAALSYYYEHRDEIDEAARAAQARTAQVLAERERLAEGPNLLDAVMTAAAVATEYHISDRTVREAIQQGWIEALKSGGTWLIRRADADARWGDRKRE